MKTTKYSGFEFNKSSAIAKIEIYDTLEVIVYYNSNPDKGYSYTSNQETVDELDIFIHLYNQYDSMSIGKFVAELIRNDKLIKN